METSLLIIDNLIGTFEIAREPERYDDTIRPLDWTKYIETITPDSVQQLINHENNSLPIVIAYEEPLLLAANGKYDDNEMHDIFENRIYSTGNRYFKIFLTYYKQPKDVIFVLLAQKYFDVSTTVNTYQVAFHNFNDICAFLKNPDEWEYWRSYIVKNTASNSIDYLIAEAKAKVKALEEEKERQKKKMKLKALEEDNKIMYPSENEEKETYKKPVRAALIPIPKVSKNQRNIQIIGKLKAKPVQNKQNKSMLISNEEYDTFEQTPQLPVTPTKPPNKNKSKYIRSPTDSVCSENINNQ